MALVKASDPDPHGGGASLNLSGGYVTFTAALFLAVTWALLLRVTPWRVAQRLLAWKLPLIQNVQYYEKRVLNLDPPNENILLADQKRLIVDVFARYRIDDPLLFFQTVRSEENARPRLNTIINGRVRQILGNATLSSVLSLLSSSLLQAASKSAMAPNSATSGAGSFTRASGCTWSIREPYPRDESAARRNGFRSRGTGRARGGSESTDPTLDRGEVFAHAYL